LTVNEFLADAAVLAKAKLSESNPMRELDCATIRVSKTTDMSGTANADEINRGGQIGKGKNLRHIASSTFLRSLLVSGLCIVLTPIPGWADKDDNPHPGREDNDKGLRAEIAAVQAQVTSLRSSISELQSEVKSLQNSNTSLQNQLTAAHNVLALAPFVSVDPNPAIGVIGPNIIFSGVNIHIRSGSGSTDDGGNPRGLGNLIIGYDEDPMEPLTGDSSLGLPTIMQTSGFPSPLNPGDRGGSHNLVIGGGNRFTQTAFGGFVAGERNTIKSFGASIGGGFFNTAGGLFATVSGGIRNVAGGLFATVSGGGLNNADGTDASVSGGFENFASGPGAAVTGGISNSASGLFSTVSGGGGNSSGGFMTIVLGGNAVTDNNDSSIAPQPPFP
jgi:hypothetical protein